MDHLGQDLWNSWAKTGETFVSRLVDHLGQDRWTIWAKTWTIWAKTCGPTEPRKESETTPFITVEVQIIGGGGSVERRDVGRL